MNETVVHNKNSRRNKKKKNEGEHETFKWRLLRYVRTEYSGMIGIIAMPSNDIGTGLTEDYVLKKLNSENCFDFDYSPQEKDSLAIQVNDRWDFYLAFTFENGNWKIGKGFDAFNDVMTMLAEGKLKLIMKDLEN